MFVAIADIGIQSIGLGKAEEEKEKVAANVTRQERDNVPLLTFGQFIINRFHSREYS